MSEKPKFSPDELKKMRKDSLRNASFKNEMAQVVSDPELEFKRKTGVEFSSARTIDDTDEKSVSVELGAKREHGIGVHEIQPSSTIPDIELEETDEPPIELAK